MDFFFCNLKPACLQRLIRKVPFLWVTLNGQDIDEIAHEVDRSSQAKDDLPGSKGHVVGGDVSNQQRNYSTNNTCKLLIKKFTAKNKCRELNCKDDFVVKLDQSEFCARLNDP